jgi:hypothetical protein
MAGFDIEELMSIKNAYQGQRFQWIKPPASERQKLGTVVTVIDVIPGRRVNTVNGPVQTYLAVLSDQSRIESEALTNNLMMLHEDQPPLTRDEVLSIYVEPELDLEAVKKDLPDDLQSLSTLQASPKNQGAPGQDDSTFAPGSSSQPVQQRQQVPIDTKGLFGMFSVEETDVNLKVSVQLPAKNLLKMMFANSQDKEQFLDQLSAHINNSITLDAIKASVRTFMGQDKKKKDDDQ